MAAGQSCVFGGSRGPLPYMTLLPTPPRCLTRRFTAGSPFGQPAVGYLAPLGWLGGDRCAVGSCPLASQSRVPLVALCTACAKWLLARVRPMALARALI
jgi:hypothetical protein